MKEQSKRESYDINLKEIEASIGSLKTSVSQYVFQLIEEGFDCIDNMIASATVQNESKYGELWESERELLTSLHDSEDLFNCTLEYPTELKATTNWQKMNVPYEYIIYSICRKELSDFNNAKSSVSGKPKRARYNLYSHIIEYTTNFKKLYSKLELSIFSFHDMLETKLSNCQEHGESLHEENGTIALLEEYLDCLKEIKTEYESYEEFFNSLNKLKELIEEG